MNWSMVLIRGMRGPVGLLAGSIALGRLVAGLGNTPYFGRIGNAADGVVGTGCLGAAALVLYFLSRLLRWERGSRGTDCRFCGGPLGCVRPGRVYFGDQLSDFRRCYNCWRPTPTDE